jgi:hypothetical protein
MCVWVRPSHVVSKRRCYTNLQSWFALMAVRKLYWSLIWSSSFQTLTLTRFKYSRFGVGGGYSKTKVYASIVYNVGRLWGRIQQFSNEMDTPGIFERLRIPFSNRAELYVTNMEAVSNASCKKVKVKRLLLIILLFISYAEPAKLRKYLRHDHEIWNGNFVRKGAHVHMNFSYLSWLSRHRPLKHGML